MKRKVSSLALATALALGAMAPAAMAAKPECPNAKNFGAVMSQEAKTKGVKGYEKHDAALAACVAVEEPDTGGWGW
ncbi:MAG: hypothetical protein OEO77_10780 [Acidimicrobiia bacterium]|nr:hypothetical protein [Acidimicrobiia bacterium]